MIDFITILKSKKIIFLIFLAGILMMLLPKPDFSLHENNDKVYSVDIEKKIESVIKKTYSLKEVSVIITYDTYGEKILEYDYEQTVSGLEDSSRKTFQKKYIGNASDKTPFIKSEKLPVVRGVLICAKDINEDVSYKIREAVSTLLGVKINKVHVIY